MNEQKELLAIPNDRRHCSNPLCLMTEPDLIADIFRARRRRKQRERDDAMVEQLIGAGER